ncbi:phage tail tape measure protein [Modicisalibacter radicis]|uniref:phage tail tape measure protein n=1 Tax=Halomonas sp. EAR18 TaxID=2518972 RepID=UPI00109CB4CA|nr:phage tail tape measure protein [Halomonas sp. EAR18]
MARDLKLQVILDAVDKATRPLKSIDRASEGAAKALKENRDRLKQLQAVQKDVSSFRTLKHQSGDTAKALREQQDRIRRLSQQMQSNQGDTAELSAERKRAVALARKLTQRYSSEEQELHRLRTQLKNNGVSTTDLMRDQRRLTEQMSQTSQAADEQRQRLKRLAEQQKALARARSNYDRGMSMRNNMAGTGASMAASGGAALYAGARLLAPGVEFGKAMSRVQALTRLDGNDEQLKALRDQARELGASTAFSAGQAANAQGFLAMAGFTPEAIKASMSDMLNLALANGTDLARTADIGSNLLTSFGLGPDEMGRLADVITATTTRANVDLEMLGDAMKYVAPQARAMGLSLEEAAAMAGLLGNVGIQGSQAGTTLRAMMTRLAAPTGKAASALKELGVNAKDADGNLRNVPKILADVAKATETMGNADRAAYLKEIFGEEPGAGMAELIAQQGAAGIEKFTEILTQAGGENARVAKTMTDNIAGDLKSLSSVWDEVGISITDTNKGPLRELIQNVTSITRGVGNWIKENPQLAGTLAKVAGALAVLVTAGGALTLMLASIMGPMVMVRYAMAMFGPNVLSAGKALLWLGSVFRTVAMFFLTNPIGLAIAALAGAAYLIYKHWEPIKAFFLGLWQQVKAAFSEGAGGVARLLLNWNPIGLIYKGITAGLSALGVEIPANFKTLGSAIVDGLIGGLAGKFTALKDKVVGMASSVKSWFADVLGINSPSRVFAEFGGWTVEGLISGLTSKIAALKDKVVGIASSVKGWFADVLDINSPSRVFAKLGGYTVDGLNQGFDAQRDEPAKRVADIAKRVSRAGAGLAIGAAALPSAAMPGITQQEPIRFDTRPPIAAGSGQQAIDNRITIGDIQVSAAPGMDERQLAQYVAQEVQRALAQAQHDASARRRSSLRDID